MGEPINIFDIKDSGVAYSICTFVTRFRQYKELVNSFVDHGFSYNDCEYIYIDNSEKRLIPQAPGVRWVVTKAGAWLRT